MDYIITIGTIAILTAILLGFLSKYNQKFLVPAIICLIIALLLVLLYYFIDGKLDINQIYVKIAIVVGILNQIFMIVKPAHGSFKDKLSYNFILPWFTGFFAGFSIYLYPEDPVVAIILILFVVGVELMLFSRKQ